MKQIINQVIIQKLKELISILKKEKERVQNRIHGKHWRDRNKDIIRKYDKMYRKKNKQALFEKRIERYRKNSEFYKLKSRTYRKNNKEKMKVRESKKRKNFIGLLKCKYEAMKNRSKKKGWRKIISKKEFIEWARNNKQYKRLFKNWKESNYKPELRPSIDRIDNDKGYIKGNLQFLTQPENFEKGWKETLDTRCKKVKIWKEDEYYIFNSGADCSRFLGVCKQAPQAALKRNSKIKGYNIEYYKEEEE